MASDDSPFPWPQQRDIHIIALVPAGLSFFATATGSYWFLALMKSHRNFRRTLVLLLILADCSKSFWIMIFSIAGLATSSHILARSAFCQVGGFFLQASFEACDIAILLLITHVSFQILPPLCIPRSQDGLWRMRYWLLPLSVLLPLANASIPFFRMPANTAYSYDGVYCSLFAGPLWLTLVLSWAPRYLLWLYLLGLLTRLYLYIRAQSYERHRNSICSANSETALQGKDNTITMDMNDIAGPDRQHSIASSIRTVNSSNQRPRNQFNAVALYPLFYILVWTVPFSLQVAAFSRSRSINANFALRAASVCCVSSLGIVDVVIFCSKEKPWRYGMRIRRGTDSSRHGSAAESRTSPADSTSNLRRPVGGGSDHDRQQALQAYERLALEQAERLARPRMKRTMPEDDFALSAPADMVALPSPM